MQLQQNQNSDWLLAVWFWEMRAQRPEPAGLLCDRWTSARLIIIQQEVLCFSSLLGSLTVAGRKYSLCARMMPAVLYLLPWSCFPKTFGDCSHFRGGQQNLQSGVTLTMENKHMFEGRGGLLMSICQRSTVIWEPKNDQQVLPFITQSVYNSHVTRVTGLHHPRLIKTDS